MFHVSFFVVMYEICVFLLETLQGQKRVQTDDNEEFRSVENILAVGSDVFMFVWILRERMVHVTMCLQQINVVYLLRTSADVCSVI